MRPTLLPDTKTKDIAENYKPISLTEKDAKIPEKFLPHQIQQYKKIDGNSLIIAVHFL